MSGQNLWTSTDYSGYNPEVNARPGNSLSPGEDLSLIHIFASIDIDEMMKGMEAVDASLYNLLVYVDDASREGSQSVSYTHLDVYKRQD